MRLLFYFVALTAASFGAWGQAPPPRAAQQVATFARLYGYVRYFHPSDEAAAADWDRLAVLGCARAAVPQTDAELKATLLALFRPLAPTLRLVPAGQRVRFRARDIAPPDGPPHQVISWQHEGLGLGDRGNAYHSRRTHRPDPAATPGPEAPLLFAPQARIGEAVQEDLGCGWRCVLPLALYGTATATYPPPVPADRATLRADLLRLRGPDLTGNTRAGRLAGVVIAWNVFQHFYPYFATTRSDWATALPEALAAAYPEQSGPDFADVLRRLTARLRDGHVRVTELTPPLLPPRRLPLTWEWVQGQLVVTQVAGDSLAVRRGDVVTAINGQPAAACFREAEQCISAATPGWLAHRAAAATATGPAGTAVRLQVQDAAGATRAVTVRYALAPDEVAAAAGVPPAPFRQLSPGVYYLNWDQLSQAALEERLPELTRARALICDLRGYPNGNHLFLAHLLARPDTAAHWMRTPRYVYPNQQRVAGYRQEGWRLQPRAPHLAARVVFLTDGRAISYAESVLGLVAGYRLGTIVGQPTAGTNGNVNRVALPGRYVISWTGMEVRKLDGTRHHGVGVTPDVRVERTLQGVHEGRDEFLEKALEVVNAP